VLVEGFLPVMLNDEALRRYEFRFRQRKKISTVTLSHNDKFLRSVCSSVGLVKSRSKPIYDAFGMSITG
jgi:hypothetical protein